MIGDFIYKKSFCPCYNNNFELYDFCFSYLEFNSFKKINECFPNPNINPHYDNIFDCIIKNKAKFLCYINLKYGHEKMNVVARKIKIRTKKLETLKHLFTTSTITDCTINKDLDDQIFEKKLIIVVSIFYLRIIVIKYTN